MQADFNPSLKLMDTKYGYSTSSQNKMFDTMCKPENKCIDSLIEFKQDPGSCSSPIGRQMNEPNRIQRTDISLSCQKF